MASTGGRPPATKELETAWRGLCSSKFLSHTRTVNKHRCVKLLRSGLVCCEAMVTETTGVSPRTALLGLGAFGDALDEDVITGGGRGGAAHPRLCGSPLRHISWSKRNWGFSGVALGSPVVNYSRTASVQH